jgi:ABC-2 type transport system permease protein
MLQGFKQKNTWDLIWQLFRTDFKLKYNDSILGFVWVLVKPFALFLIMYTVLTKVFVNPNPNFPLYLLLGNMFISFWTEGTSQGMESLLSKASLITKVNFPRYIVLLSSSLLSIVNFVINLVIFFIIASVRGLDISFIHGLWFAYCVFILYALVISISMFISVAYVKFRDLKQIWELFNQLVFWATPVIYFIPDVASRSRILEIILTKLNPLSVLLTSARNAVLYKDITYQPNVFIWSGIVLIAGSAGYIYYKSSIKRIAEFF